MSDSDEYDSTLTQSQNEHGTPDDSSLADGGTSTGSTTTHGRRGKKRKKTSWVWNHFLTEGNRVICMECTSSSVRDPATFSVETSTGNLRPHLEKKHRITSNSGTPDSSQTTLTAQGVLQRPNTLGNEALEKVTTELTRFIVDAKLPFNVVEKKAFRSYMHRMNPRVPPYSRRTIVRCIEDEHKQTMPEIKKVLQHITSGIALTCDGWSSRVYRGYFVVTAHWITEEFELKHIVLEFSYFPEPHNQCTTKALLLRILLGLVTCENC